jgi:hypothetical protein
MAMYEQSVVYRYFLTDLMTNEVISEVPFKSVSFERANRRAGSFSGTIAFIPETKGLDLYEATMPGRSGLYIVRNNVVIWGGIIWSRSYQVSDKSLSVNGAEFISYFYHRNIWQTLIYGSEYIGLVSYSVSNGFATINTEEPHGFSVGDRVGITYTNPAVDGPHTVSSVPSATSFTSSSTAANIPVTQNNAGACRLLVDTYDFCRDIVQQVSSDLSGLNFVNEEIKPAKELQSSVIFKERNNGIVTLRTSRPHDAILGQEIEVLEVGSGLDGLYVIDSVPDANTITYILLGPNVARSSLSGIRILNVARKSLTGNIFPNPSTATITTDVPHDASPGQVVYLDQVDGFFTGELDAIFNGRFTINTVLNSNQFTYLTGGILPVGDSPANGGTAAFGSRFVYGDYGSYTNNSDLGIEFSTNEKSGLYQDTQFIRGFEGRTAGEILEQYSTNIDGFEYRIDCGYDFDTASFTRTFVITSSEPAEAPPEGGIYPVTSLGAHLLVFEYPGNISTFSVQESAEESATRFFVQGNIPDLGTEASKPYAAAAAKDLLSNKNGRDWPLLDQLEILNDVSDEFALYNYATDYLYESRPPIGEFKLTVNGTIDPVVGSYFPGDWCSVLINDEFVRSRLANDQEPRDDIIVRRIERYKVSVPDTPNFPEVVDLTLIPDWKVDIANGN